MPLISVVIPVYNEAQNLKTSLPSLFRQVFKDIEVIAVDEGSTDGSLELLLRHERAGRLQLLHSRYDAGPLVACNDGARIAIGDWLMFFNARDLLLFDHLSRMAEAMARHPDIELFINAYQCMSGQRGLIKVSPLPQGVLGRLDALAAYAHEDFIHPYAACLRRQRFLALGGFPEQYSHGGEDYFWLKALCELDAIHYDDTVTSLWQEAEGGLRWGNILPPHPARDLPGTYRKRLTRREWRWLLAAVNRKLLDWGMENKRWGYPVRPTLGALRLSGMTSEHWPLLLRLILPHAWSRRLLDHSK
ncbi:glycosyltransferase family 2 protein [Billgrantia diversa]|uniref:glycosyltransferase family 2 protein n=1 Tax=Halomonas sp. MCCC 1A13316 TaxID=2733487 RepID=UPI0018A64B89|nr:glycosyltransferase family A protein [Halomonas sp. MCCC 1A13316]QOR37188.1 glycosyltransferase family 2 protein [Halomonas sp. MCCC 1A13316]